MRRAYKLGTTLPLYELKLLYELDGESQKIPSGRSDVRIDNSENYSQQ
jgi:hypothetical protein